MQSLLDEFQIAVSNIPVLIHRGERVLRNPSNEEIAQMLGFNESVSEYRSQSSRTNCYR